MAPETLRSANRPLSAAARVRTGIVISYWQAQILVPDDRDTAARRIRLALVGFGYWGPNYARVLNDLPDADLTFVCDRSADRLNLVRQRYRAVGTCTATD